MIATGNGMILPAAGLLRLSVPARIRCHEARFGSQAGVRRLLGFAALSANLRPPRTTTPHPNRRLALSAAKPNKPPQHPKSASLAAPVHDLLLMQSCYNVKHQDCRGVACRPAAPGQQSLASRSNRLSRYGSETGTVEGEARCAIAACAIFIMTSQNVSAC